MKTAWVVLLISALTDFLITVGTALQASMYQADAVTGATTVVMPSKAAIIATLLGAGLIAARTIQQKLSTTLANLADLKGAPAPEVIKQGDVIVTKLTVPLKPEKDERIFTPEQVRELIKECNMATEDLNKVAKGPDAKA